MEILAAVAHKVSEPLTFETVHLAKPEPNEVLVKLVATGFCHTDAVCHAQIVPVPLPAVFGHEGSGTVVEVGSAVTEFKPGDRVGFAFAMCGSCNRCRSAEPFACDTFNELNFGGVSALGNNPITDSDGNKVSTFFGQSSFASHAVVHENSVIKVTNDDIDLALIGPLGCGIQTGAGAVFNRIKPEVNATIAIFGVGAVGLSALMAAKIEGCKTIIAVDLNQENLAMATELGATHTFNPAKQDDLVGFIKDLTDGGLQYGVETTGNAGSVKNALASLRFGGTLVVLGITGDIELNLMNDLMAEGKTLTGCIEGDSNPKVFIPKLLELHEQGKFPFDKFVTMYDFADINQVFEDAHEGKVIKAIMRMPE